MTNFLTDIEKAWMRAEVENIALPDTCDILSITLTYDGQGGYSEAWGTATASVACRIDPSGNTSGNIEQLSGAAIQPFSRFTVTLPYNTTVTQANRIQISGTQYNILGIDAVRSYDMCIRCEVEKV